MRLFTEIICIIFIISHVCCESFWKNLHQIFNARHVLCLLKMCCGCLHHSNVVDKIDALDQWCICKLLGIKWYHHVWNDDVRWKTEQPHLSATVQARSLSLFGHNAQMPDESDAKQILTASHWRTGRDHRDAPTLCGWRLPSRTWNQLTSPSTKQLCLRIVHSGEWCLCLALRTHSGACQKWMNEWMKERMLSSVVKLSVKLACRSYWPDIIISSSSYHIDHL